PPRSPLFPYTTLFRSNSSSLAYAFSAGSSEASTAKPSGPSQTAVPARNATGTMNQFPSPPVACAVGSFRRLRRKPHGTNKSNGRSEEHTSELQSRENL